MVGFDKAGGLGGTWYWNRYPGALSDTESHLYRYSFDRDLLQDGTWKTTYITQPEILEYLEHVVDRFDLRRHFRFDTEVDVRHLLDDEGLWEVTTDDGSRVPGHLRHQRASVCCRPSTSRTCPAWTPSRARPSTPPPGPRAWTSRARRVGVIGTGSTGQQVITALAPEVEHLTVFVRTPQYSVPVGNRPVTTDADRRGSRPTTTRSGRRSSAPPSRSASRRAPCRR